MTKNKGAIEGFTTNNGLLLDLDNTTLHETRQIAKKYLKKWNLEGYLIAKSSQNNYHIIFNKYLPWETTLEYLFKIVWTYHYHKHNDKPHLTNWAILQTIKHSCTLRISNKHEKKPPTIIETKGKTENLIKDYLAFYTMLNGEKKGGETP
jgi:hypothetical protein